MKIYTKTGDGGSTSLFDNIRIYKDDIRIESYGTIDELVSWLGLAKNYVEDEKIYEHILQIQNKLFTVGANLATSDKSKVKFHMKEEDIKDLEDLIDYYMEKSKSHGGFIVPGSGKKSAYMHVARTVCRRAERLIISLSREVDVDSILIKYINRLSDAIYAIARFLEEEEIKVSY